MCYEYYVNRLFVGNAYVMQRRHVSLLPRIPMIGPVINPTQSWWLKDQSAPIAPPPSLPERCDIAIIGAGMTGASIAYWLSKLHGRSCILLDARGVAGGATGRNGGHLWPRMNLQLESDTRKELLEFIRENNVDCDLTEWGAVDLEIRPVNNADVSDDSDNSDSSSSSDDTWGELEYWDEETTAKRFGTDAFAMAEYNKHAAQFYPAKVTQAMIDASDPLTKVYAPVRVLKIIDDVNGCGSILETDYGSVVADQVVVASNAWTSELLPELANYLYPCRNQVLMTTPSNIPNSWGAGAFSVGAMTGSGDIEDEIYCIRRPDGRMCVGGARYLETDAAIGNNDDGSLSEVVGKRIREFMETSFPNLAPLIIEAEWTGIIALTSDRKPIVGRMPSRKNVLVAAGYNGSGMSMCFGIGKYIANIAINNGVDEEELSPHIRILSPARFLGK